MNKAIALGETVQLRDMLALSDKFDDLQAFVLSPDTAVEIAGSIVSERKSYYRRARSVCRRIIGLMEASKFLRLTVLNAVSFQTLRKMLIPSGGRRGFQRTNMQNFNRQGSHFREERLLALIQQGCFPPY